MIGSVLDHLWQSTFFALAAGVLAWSFRGARASVRFGIWFAASAKFLVPFAALAALGRLLGPELRPPPDAAPGAAFIAQAAQPFSQPAAAGLAVSPAPLTAQATTAWDPVLALALVWAAGSALVLIVWMARWMRVRSLVRGATPLALAAPMPVLASSSVLEPGLVGLWRPVLVLPDTLFEHLDRTAIKALVAHEACHQRRRDNLLAAFHMLVEALFWFHPLVWWIGARLIGERERACDEAVIRSGHDRAAYARGLVECCRLYLRSPLRCVAGASGSNLARRVESIMIAPLRSPLSPPAKAALIAAGACALAAPVAAGWLTTPAGRQAAAHVAAFASRAAAAGVQEIRMAGPRTNAREPAPPSRAAAPATAAPRPALEIAEAPGVSPAPANVEVSKASLIPVSTQTVAPGLVFIAMPISAVRASAALIPDPVWVRLPSLRAIADVDPIAADARRIPGSATMRCRTDGRGYLSRCVVTSERPAGLGFGRAAEFLQTRFKLRTRAADGTAVRGRLVDVSLDFTPRF